MGIMGAEVLCMQPVNRKTTTALPKRQLGRSDLEGVGARTGLHGDELRVFAGAKRRGHDYVVSAAVDRGVTLFDTAEVYGPYTNEDLSARRSRRIAIAWYCDEVRFSLGRKAGKTAWIVVPNTFATSSKHR